MDAYPPDYVAHNLPLVVLSGLGDESRLQDSGPVYKLLQENGTPIDSEIPTVTGERAEQLLQEFFKTDASDAPWNSRPVKSRGNLSGFRVRAVGREYILPARKADPPPASPSLSSPTSSSSGGAPAWVLHSPISPLSPDSPIFPDGVMTPLWVAKHQHHIPATLISFFDFASDPSRNSLHDNQLKSEINRIKGILTNSGYKTRYAVVLLSDKTILQAPDIEERLGNIRRATGLDPKNSLFFLPPDTSRVEVASFVHSVLVALQPLCVEYYRDLTKHARRKKGRGQIPPPTAPPTRGTSQTLSSQGWGARYEYKLGVFAEFRQEMDAAGRHYSFALDALLGPDGVFETTASWSPRWDEARLLADTTAMRILRCLLWNGLPTSAVQSWVNYRDRMRDLVDRRGKGSANYGWQAWESRWAKVMAETIQKVELPPFAISEPIRDPDVVPGGENVLFMPAEKSIPVGERLPPWHLLHHAGYWLSLSARHAIARRDIAEEIPEEDRTSPGQSPAHQVVNRYGTYDTYLVPEPHEESPLPSSSKKGFDHTSQIVDTLNEAINEFYARGQQRAVDRLQLDTGKALMHAGRYSNALNVLTPLWEGMSWRAERWWSLASQVTWTLHGCAVRLQEAKTIVATEWELHSEFINSAPSHQYDLISCLNSLSARTKEKIEVSLTSKSTMSPFFTSFTYAHDEGHVGEPLRAQLVVQSRAQQNSAPIVLSAVKVGLTGSIEELQISHTPSSSESPSGPGKRLAMVEVELHENTNSKISHITSRLTGNTDLTFCPWQTKVFVFAINFKEAGDVSAVDGTLVVETERFILTYTSVVEEPESMPVWWYTARDALKTKRLRAASAASTKILPKPPKMQIFLPNLQTAYYTHEPVTLNIELFNGEDEETEAVLEVRFLGRSGSTLAFSWKSPEKAEQGSMIADQEDDANSEIDLPGHQVGKISPGARCTQSITFTTPPDPAEYTLEIKVLYHLITDLETPISKTLTTDFFFADPWEAAYDFSPRVHSDPWPSFFHVDEKQTLEAPAELSLDAAVGIAQTWLATARLENFAEEGLIVEDLSLVLQAVNGGAVCAISKEFPAGTETRIPRQELREYNFSLEVRKLTLEDRRPVSLDLRLDIKYRRKTGGASITTSKPCPRFIVPSSEPRVLCTASQSPTPATAPTPPLITLTYTLENPTLHFLAFDLTMEASEEFAFSGPKAGAVQLLPMSRQDVRFRILPLVKGAWISPQLRVVDRYFGKVLKVLPTEGLRVDRGAVGVWVDAEEEGG
ncbi:hypothetical protein H2201_001235 [Coniosporium apollinis]|uniref:Trafficking protein particle complex subunit 11 domain-containing protein n=1 Tax=Coniosporium apollinis TaxID=61459 RepID=A0ABQ9P2U8_9PEZI|nr:hypothetical protein H2201_001235 [Coniosporium apollinis]